VDDGAASLEESVGMLRDAATAGTTDIVATPHANLQFKFDPELNRQLADQLSAEVGDRIRLHLGCDFHLTFDNIQALMVSPARFTINGGPYLLVEFSDLVIFRNTTEIFQQCLSAGIVPVITHPERNSLLQQRLEELRAWVASGCLLQVTTQSLTGYWGSRARKFSETLMSENLVHVFASDGHDLKHRPARMDEAYAQVKQDWGEPRAQRLFIENPKAVIEGVPLPNPLDVEPRRKAWYQLW
jgi:protein-tyrosine phosphatase